MSSVGDGLGKPRLEILGQARILLPDGTSQTGLTRRLALLSILALRSPGVISRVELCRLLWPDVPLPRARRSLSSLCYSIKGAVGDVLRVDGDHIALDESSVTVDVLEFRAAVRHSDFGRARKLYVGPLLDGSAGMDGSPFGQLVDRMRLELELLHEQATATVSDPAPGTTESGVDRPAPALRRKWALVTAVTAMAAVAVPLAVGFPDARSSRVPLEVIVADFVTAPEDRTLGATVSHALQIDLEGSERIRVASGYQVRRALERMRLQDAAVDEDVALEIARREGLEAVLGGEARRVGSGFVLMTRLTSASTGSILPNGAARVSVADSSALIVAIDELSRAMRSTLGESARSLEAQRPLASVTTSSFRALELYTQAEHVRRVRGDGLSAVTFYDEAVLADSLFASAYLRKADAELVAGRLAAATTAVTRAYEFRDRLSPQDIDVVTGMYRQVVEGDLHGSKRAYERAIATGQQVEPSLLIRAGAVDTHVGDLRGARTRLEEAIREDPSEFLAWRYLVRVAWLQGEQAEARDLMAEMRHQFPGDPRVAAVEAHLAASNLELERAHILLDSLSRHDPRSPEFRVFALADLASLELTRGRVQRAVDLMERAQEEFRTLGLHHWSAQMEVRRAYTTMAFEHRFDEPVERLGRALAAMDRDSVPTVDRPYGDLAVAFAGARDWASAAEMVSRMDRHFVDQGAPSTQWMTPFRVIEASTAGPEARGYVDPWLPEHAGGSQLCRTCGLPILAKELMHMGQRQRALELYRRFRAQGNWGRALLGNPASGADPYWLGIVLEDTGQLAAEEGAVQEAIDAYSELAALWADADPPLRERATRARAHADSLRVGARP